MSTIIATTLSNGSVSVPTATVVNGSAKAWSNIDGTGTVSVLKSLNVASVTDRGTGQYTSNFSSGFTDANFLCLGTNSQAGDGAESVTSFDGVTTSNASYRVTNTANQGYLDKDRVYTMYSGDLA